MDPERAVLIEAEGQVMTAEAQILRENALQHLAARPGLAWSKYYDGKYVVALDGVEVGTVRSTRWSAGRRSR